MEFIVLLLIVTLDLVDFVGVDFFGACGLAGLDGLAVFVAAVGDFAAKSSPARPQDDLVLCFSTAVLSLLLLSCGTGSEMVC